MITDPLSGKEPEPSTKSGQVQVLSFETANCWLDPPAQPHTQGCTVGAVHVAGIDTANIPLTFVRSNREPTTQDPRTLFQQSRRHLGSALHHVKRWLSTHTASLLLPAADAVCKIVARLYYSNSSVYTRSLVIVGF